jgi:hypothetical protein
LQQVKTWYYNHGRNTAAKPAFKNPRKVSLLQVINRDRKDEVSALATELSGGAHSGSQEHFAKYATALATVKGRLSAEELAAAEEERKRWDEEGLPDEMKVNNGLKYSKAMIMSSAEAYYKATGGRELRLEYHFDKDGTVLWHL